MDWVVLALARTHRPTLEYCIGKLKSPSLCLMATWLDKEISGKNNENKSKSVNNLEILTNGLSILSEWKCKWYN